jgi:hypothetical protein
MLSLKIDLKELISWIKQMVKQNTDMLPNKVIN